MKKLLAILLCLTMLISVVSLASCGKDDDDDDKGKESQSQSQTEEDLTPATLNGKSPKEAYAAAKALATTYTNGTLDVTSAQKATISGAESSVTIKMHVKTAGDLAYMSMSMGEETMGEMWYDGTYVYENEGEDKIKEAVSKEDFASYAGIDELIAIFVDLSDAVFAGKEFEKNATTGNYSLAVELTGDDLDAVAEIIGAEGVKDDKIALVMTFDKDANLLDASYTFAMMEEDVTVETGIVMAFSAMGTTTVTLPTDLDDYVEEEPGPGGDDPVPGPGGDDPVPGPGGDDPVPGPGGDDPVPGPGGDDPEPEEPEMTLIYEQKFDDAALADKADSELADAIFGTGNHNAAEQGTKLSIENGGLKIDTTAAATDFFNMVLSTDVNLSDGYVAEMDYTFSEWVTTDNINGRFVSFSSHEATKNNWVDMTVVGPYSAGINDGSPNARVGSRPGGSWKGWLSTYGTPENINTWGTTYRMRATITLDGAKLEVAKYTNGVLGEYVEIASTTDVYPEQTMKDLLTLCIQKQNVVTVDNIEIFVFNAEYEDAADDIFPPQA